MLIFGNYHYQLIKWLQILHIFQIEAHPSCSQVSFIFGLEISKLIKIKKFTILKGAWGTKGPKEKSHIKGLYFANSKR